MPFYRLTAPSEGFFKDRGSKFYAFAFPVDAQETVDHHLQQLRKQFYDARHRCTAYRLGNEGETVYMNDDGEPSNTAGAPILAAIRSAELTNILVVVVRYFGGTKLGVRGLIDAYRTATETALNAAPKEEIISWVYVTFDFPYNQTSYINKLLHPFPVEQVSAEYLATCKVTYRIRENEYGKLEQAIQQTPLRVKIQHIKK
ncbi:MAG: YigZ family protein [Bacteroidota bacterium]